ncbi:MAG: phosphatidylinositol mannoside acyltransferase [Corynebacterium sp.]|uniref:phosphatidylinositol mannoside acyltransferase n=1 Tax=Corynebacterium sp. TaxID=1720 RepID=UPI0026E08F37|nr:phosphatidylinositol mannoside acyltransferase [Corynebacterium sp.]MDO5670624.1 phosphatidylinositol mannoside acyltransferase [Corynebacterium sp.]
MSIDPVAVGYLAGWKVVRYLPEKVAEQLFNAAADYACDGGRGMEMLRRNLTRVVGAENVTRELVRASMRSYARYWREAFRLPALVDVPLLDAHVTGLSHLDASRAAGKGVILTLPHSGNWDMAGLYLTRTRGTFTTVAERLKPEVLFRAFVDFRESLGFEVLPLTGGNPPYGRLSEVLAGGGVVALMGERDMRGTGVAVDFFGEETTFPRGPAQLALDTGAALHVVHSWFDDDAWGLSVSAPLVVDSVEATTQRIADGFAANIARHPQDWHMLQPQWPADRRRP